ncbi:MAG: hypothetical protein FJ004_04985 [Chloroflexi bacterium]|nr:hypothetical protein [Chloroflexota bacterium]
MLKDERGQVLALALAALAVGALLIAPFLNTVSVHSIANRAYRSSTMEQYASDAGVEDAIWALTSGTLASRLTYPGAAVSHTVSEPINGILPAVTVTRDMVPIASDDFESGGWSGGSGWLAAWSYTGDASITTSGDPYQGACHLMLSRNTGYVKRPVNLSGHTSARLRFCANAVSFEAAEEAYCQISPDGSTWTTIKTWRNGDDTGVYTYYDIDLSSYKLSSQFWIAFQAKMADASDYLYIDSIEILRVFNGTLSLPWDNFESAGWTGGSVWLGDWSYAGSVGITASGTPEQGKYHALMSSSGSYMGRAANLYGLSALHLVFWAKVYSFEAGDTVTLQVSPNGSTWTTIKTWTSADSDSIYRYYDIDLASFAVYSTQFWIRFNSGMNQASDYFYVDDLKYTGCTAYEIASSAGDEVTRSDVVITDGVFSISFWQVNEN